MHTRRQESIGAVACVILLLITGLLSGCTNNKESTNHGTFVLFTNAQEETLDAVDSDYSLLLRNHSAQDARVELVNRLNNGSDEIAFAELGDDNYTIFIDFSNGRCVAYDTFDAQEYNTSSILSGDDSSGQDFSPFTGSPLHSDGSAQTDVPQHDDAIVFSPGAPSVSFAPEDTSVRVTCEKKKVLMLVPCCYEGVSAHRTCEQYFKASGWTDEDIVIKENKGFTSMDMKPEDFFHLEEYGIILIFAHGTIRDRFDEKKMWLECCTLDNKTIQSTPAYQEALNQSILIVRRARDWDDNETNLYYNLMIRKDVLKENIGTLQASYVHLATCYGIIFKDVFVSNGAAIVLGWNQPALDTYTDPNQVNCVRCMLEKNYSVYASYMDEDTVRAYTSQVMHGVLDVLFLMSPAPEESSIARNFYFPAWLDVSVTGVPEGAGSLQVKVLSDTGLEELSSEQALQPGASTVQMESLRSQVFAPGKNMTVQVQAYSSEGGMLLTSREVRTDLVAGVNPLSVSLAASKTNVCVFSGDRTTIAPIPGALEGELLVYPGNTTWSHIVYNLSSTPQQFTYKPGDGMYLSYSVIIEPKQDERCYTIGPVWLHLLDDQGNSIESWKVFNVTDVGCVDGSLYSEPYKCQMLGYPFYIPSR